MAPEPASAHGQRHVCRADRRIHWLCAQRMGRRGRRGDRRLGCRHPDRGTHAAHRARDVARASDAQRSAISNAIRSARGQLAAAEPTESNGNGSGPCSPPARSRQSKFRNVPIQCPWRSMSRELPSPVPDDSTQEQLPAGSKRPGRSPRGEDESPAQPLSAEVGQQAGASNRKRPAEAHGQSSASANGVALHPRRRFQNARTRA